MTYTKEQVQQAYKQGLKDQAWGHIMQFSMFSIVISIAIFLFKFLIVPAADAHFERTRYIRVPCESQWEYPPDERPIDLDTDIWVD